MKKIKNFEQFLNEELFGLSKKERDEKEEKYKKLKEIHDKEVQDMERRENQDLVDLFRSDKPTDDKEKN